MKFILLTITVLFIFDSVESLGKLSELIDDTISEADAFNVFKLHYNKKYKHLVEETERKARFVDNLNLIRNHMKDYAAGKVGYTLKMNEFMDWTKDELKRRKGHVRKHPKTNSIIPPPPPLTHRRKRALPVSLDYRNDGVINDIQNQGDCGCCYSFAATAAIEAQLAWASGYLYKLSEQQGADCSSAFGNDGCDGGLGQQVYDYLKHTGGIALEKNYPYTLVNSETTSSCKYSSKLKSKANITGYIDIKPDEASLLDALVNYGPIDTGIDASQDSFMFYDAGVYNDPGCKKGIYDLDHEVLLIGYGTTKAGVKYWILKNQYGLDWGINGYMYIARNQNNMCGIATDACFPIVEVQ